MPAPTKPQLLFSTARNTNSSASAGRPSAQRKFWFFWGGLTDVEYTITVTDAQTGASRSYHHPAGSASGGFDTGAF